MLIDKFEKRFFAELDGRVTNQQQQCKLYLLIDGAFVNGIHKLFKEEEKRVLFDSLPSSKNEARNVSPFLIQLNSRDQRQRILLARSNGWPMISLIETPEDLAGLYARLAAWCVVEVDKDRFNFRFADTRRLPAIVKYINFDQRSHFAGPALRWSYVGRDGKWKDLDIAERTTKDASLDFVPVLEKSQFAALVDDGRADEVLAIMAYRGEDVNCTHFQRWSLTMDAIEVADQFDLSESDSIEWAIWCVKNYPSGTPDLSNTLEEWRQDNNALEREI